ncbi:putative XPG/Rad2 endonuclease, PIN-like domain superfamily, 5'-3' exonuclease domain superfamily [Plasmopara halstedii]
MGVTGLLPVLKSVMDQVHVSKYDGNTVGVDASDWLYKGAYSCPVDLVLGRPTDAYLNYAMQHLKLLQQHNIRPILVFDGAPLPSKAQENAARSRFRANWLQKARKLLQEAKEDQDPRAVFSACTKAVSVTNDMIMRLIAVLRKMNITFYVAPYEADAQLAFLSRQKIVDVVISQDSDCVPYGVKTVLYKLNSDGWGCELKRRSLGANEELSFVGWSEEMFIQLCVLAGCDYCPSVSGVGIITAYKLVNENKTPIKVLKALQQQKGSLVPENFSEQFYSAILTYRHQLVFDPRDGKLKMLSPLDVSKDILPLVEKGLHFLGNVELRDEVVASIASGQLHPVTHESYVWNNTAANVRLEEEPGISNSKTSRTRSLTSSESSGMAMPQQDYRPIDPLFGEISSHMRTANPRTRYQKPRPSSCSSWTHLDSVLGSSDHIVNFRSPKVSENFRPLAALHDPSASIRSLSINAQDLKNFKSLPIRDQVKRVRNPTNRRRDGKGSGFDGEVLCRVEHGNVSNPGTITESRLKSAAIEGNYGRLTDEENAPLKQEKRRRLSQCPSLPSSSLSSQGSNCFSHTQLYRPTPFGCGQRPFSPTNSVHKLPPRHSQHTYPADPKPTSRNAFAVSAEEKWDRILCEELDETNSSGSQVGDDEVSCARSSSCVSHRQPLASINEVLNDS